MVVLYLLFEGQQKVWRLRAGQKISSSQSHNSTALGMSTLEHPSTEAYCWEGAGCTSIECPFLTPLQSRSPNRFWINVPKKEKRRKKELFILFLKGCSVEIYWFLGPVYFLFHCELFFVVFVFLISGRLQHYLFPNICETHCHTTPTPTSYEKHVHTICIPKRRANICSAANFSDQSVQNYPRCSFMSW